MSTDGISQGPEGAQTGRTGTDLERAELERKLKDDLAKVADTAGHDVKAVGAELGSEIQHLKDEAGEQIDTLRHEATAQIEAGVEKAKGFAGEQKDVVARQLSSVADALSKVGGELSGEQAAIGRYAGDASNALRRFAQTVESNDVDQLMGRIEGFARKQPVAFLGIAGIAGIAASRFLMASAQRRTPEPAPSTTGTSAYRSQANPLRTGSTTQSYGATPTRTATDYPARTTSPIGGINERD